MESGSMFTATAVPDSLQNNILHDVRDFCLNLLTFMSDVFLLQWSNLLPAPDLQRKGGRIPLRTPQSCTYTLGPLEPYASRL